MFENLLGQNSAGRLIDDIVSGIFAPAVLFSGPPASGKGTAVLELGRIISCEESPFDILGAAQNAAAGLAADKAGAAWNCACPACARHRLLIHPDLLCLGSRQFSSEIAASARTFLRDTGNTSSRILFIRSVRKLLARFNPVLWEDDPKAGKIAPLVNSLEEDLDEMYLFSSPDTAGTGNGSPELEKLCEGILKDAVKLEAEGMGETIPIAHIRRASSWCRLSPAGRGKLLVIENADLMHEEGRNSLLKLLEEPPPRVTLALTTSKPGSLLPTILSRLRPYRFAARSPETEAEVIRRVFKDDSGGNSISAYLELFLPVSNETLETLAAYFASSAAYKAALICKRQSRRIPDEVTALGKYASSIAEEAGLGRPRGDMTAITGIVLEKADNFTVRSLFSRFLFCLLEQASRSGARSIAYNEVWRKCVLWAGNAAGLYNIRPAQVLEKLFTDLSRELAGL